MKVLIIGRGGREHAIVEAVYNSPQVEKIYCAPGNPGIEQYASLVNIEETNISELIKFCQDKKIDLTIVGPEVALEAGIVDEFEKENLQIFGPNLKAAQIEISKEFAKEIMTKFQIPTAKYQGFNDFEEALNYLQTVSFPIVIKYDGLAAGKGVVICHDFIQAKKAVDEILNKKIFGTRKIIIEDFLEGPEFSFMAFVGDGHVYPMAIAQDHKRAYDGDLGPNTGGMGAYSPVSHITDEDRDFALEKIIIPLVNGLLKEGINFKGVLYAGLMKTDQGIKVIEFNARFGDPETEVVLPRLKGDIIEIINGIITNKHDFKVEWKEEVTIGVVLASKGYPNNYQKNYEITGLDKLSCKVYHMGTKKVNGKLLTDGGRVLFLVTSAKTIDEAAKIVYNEISKVKCDNLYYRQDIAYQVREK